MRVWSAGLGLACAVAGVATAGDREGEIRLEARWALVRPDAELPAALIDPEGTTRWDLSGLEPEPDRVRRTVTARSDALEAIEANDDGSGEARVRFRAVGPEAISWLLPHGDPERLIDTKPSKPLRIEQAGVWSTVEVRRVGLGWVLLPSGPREAVVQRAWIRSDAGDTDHGMLLHRWVDPRVGPIVEVWGPASAGGSGRLAVSGIAFVEQVLAGSSAQRLYVDQVDGQPCAVVPELCNSRLAFGYDRGGRTCTNNGNACVTSGDCGLFGQCLGPVSILTSPSFPDVGTLLTAGAWDFSSTDSTNDVGVVTSTFAAVDADETCNFGQCGFNAAYTLSREDRLIEGASTPSKTFSVTERTQPAAGPVTLWLRGGTRFEGETGGLGSGESRFCYDPAEDLSPVPLWEFASEDATGWYMVNGDAWSSPEFLCEQNIFNHVCPSDCDNVLLCRIYVNACQGYAGKQFTEVVAEGPLTLPSGHTFHSLVARNVSEFCVHPDNSSCNSLFPTKVRTVVHLWQVPWLGTVVRLVSEQNAPADLGASNDYAETDIKFGLFPPVSISVTGSDDDSVDLAWDPGVEAAHIDGFRIQWGPQSGAEAPYANALIQSAGAGTTATVDGLLAGEEYFFTVTALSDYENPSTGLVQTYESLVFPMTVQSTEGGFVPVEVAAATTCTGGVPPVEIDGLTGRRVGDGDVELCWEASNNGCVEGYRILGAASPESVGNFAILSDSGPTNCETLINPAAGYFLVGALGSSGTGPLGHFGQ